MTKKLPAKRFDPAACTNESELASALREAFGVPFDFWIGPGPWAQLSRGVNTACDSDTGDGKIAELLEAALRDRTCGAIALDFPDGGCLMVVPIDQGAGPRLAATARFAGPNGHARAGLPVLAGEPKLLRQMADLLVENFALRRQRDVANRDLDAYAAQVSQSFEELTLWHDVISRLDVTADLWQMARAVIPSLCETLHAENVAVLSAKKPNADDRWDTLHLAVVPGLWAGSRRITEQVCADIVKALQQAPCRLTVKNRLRGVIDGRSFPGIDSFVLAPLADGETVFGWLLATNRTDGQEFGTAEANLMSSTASILTSHGRNADLFREKESLLVGVVRALVSAIDAKDPNTRGHSERVGLIAKRLGQELGLAEKPCDELYLTGMLHDIGKIGVTDYLLRKPGKLTPEEFDEVKRHVEIGYAILKDLPQVAYALPGVRHHHENYNGNGYPDGLVGEEIPMVARILAVADAFDAMSSHRPYRRAVATRNVEDILRQGADEQWDARVVKAFFSVLPDIRTLRDSHCSSAQLHHPGFGAQASSGATF